jgi:acylphosphatase
MADANSSRHERRQIYYSGRVQGVGFRYTVRQLAEPRDVTGFVQNLPDGRVELVVEGLPAELDALLDQIAGQMGENIRHAAVDRRPATFEFSDFRIRH